MLQRICQNLLNFRNRRSPRTRGPDSAECKWGISGCILKRSNRASNSVESESVVIQYLLFVRLIEISNYGHTLIRSDGRKNADK